MSFKSVSQYWATRSSEGHSKVKQFPLSFYTHELTDILVRQQKIRGWCWPRCKHCGKHYPRPLNTGGGGNYSSWCYECRGPNDFGVQYLRKYDLSYLEYMAMKERTKGKCEICGEPPGLYFERNKSHGTELHVDHCHRTGAVRGLLCWRCNVTLPSLENSIEWLNSALRYLKRDLVVVNGLETVLSVEGISRRPSPGA